MHLLIYNPVAGNSVDELDTIKNLFYQYEIELVTMVTSENKGIVQQLSTHKNEYTAIVVAGGDGTVSEVIEAMIKCESKTKLIIYPRGTSNEYAENFKITKDTLEEYLRGNTQEQKVDLGLYNEKYIFTYSFAFGNYSHIPYETPQWLKNRIGFYAYWLYAFVSVYILRIKRYNMKFMFSDVEISEKVLFGSISNSKTLGRIINLKDVSFNDGLLELFIVKSPSSFKEVVGFIHDARTGDDTSGLLIHKKINSLTISSEKKHSWSADGEYSGKYEDLTISVLENAITIVSNK